MKGQQSYIFAHYKKRVKIHALVSNARQGLYAVLVPDCFLDPHYVVSSAEKRNSFKNVTVGSVLTLSDKSLEANAKYIHIVSSGFETGTRL